MELEKIGTIMKIDSNGFLVNEASIFNFQGKWKEVVDEAVGVYRSHLGEELHSIYVRGSVARGEAREGISDVDTEAVLNISGKELQSLDIEWRKSARKHLVEEYPFQTGVEFVFLSRESLSFTDRFVLQTQSVCVFGDSIVEEWEPIPFDDTTVQKLLEENDIEKKLGSTLAEMKEQKDIKIFKKYLVWVCKRFLRFGVLLSARKEKKYTRDLYPSYELFIAQYLEKEKEMYQVLELAINPGKMPEGVLDFIKLFGEWLVEEKKRNV
jgi:predicted nucleotidyltransferase